MIVRGRSHSKKLVSVALVVALALVGCQQPKTAEQLVLDRAPELGYTTVFGAVDGDPLVEMRNRKGSLLIVDADADMWIGEVDVTSDGSYVFQLAPGNYYLLEYKEEGSRALTGDDFRTTIPMGWIPGDLTSTSRIQPNARFSVSEGSKAVYIGLLITSPDFEVRDEQEADPSRFASRYGEYAITCSKSLMTLGVRR